MKKISFTPIVIALFIGVIFSTTSCNREPQKFRLLYWNIQNGMWDGQNDNYDRFVEFVKGIDPDICVWCEGQSIYYTNSDSAMLPSERYLTDGWKELALRYGHKYWGVGGYRDDYPQVVTSKYPIEYVDKLIGVEPDSVVSHGCGWARLELAGHAVNIVTLHTWPQAWKFRAEDKDSSKALREGDWYRKMELEFICNHTIKSVPDAENQYWMMMGDFNSRSRVDNAVYQYPEDDSRFLVHDYIRDNTPYIDVVNRFYNGEFVRTMPGDSRIDFIYATKPMFESMTRAEVISNDYTTPVRDPQELSNFWRPSDHRPIVVEFEF